jgi:hypothetical protein
MVAGGFKLQHLICVAMVVFMSAFKMPSSSRLFQRSLIVNMNDRQQEQEPYVYDKAPKSAREKAAFKSQVPFSDDMYERLKSSIGQCQFNNSVRSSNSASSWLELLQII